MTESIGELPELPLSKWEATKDTLHLWVQIVGKVRLGSTAPRNHWWHVPLYLDVRGLTTRRMHADAGVTFEIRFDFIDHSLVAATNRGAVESFDLFDGLSVAEFDARLHAALSRLGVDVAIRELPRQDARRFLPAEIMREIYWELLLRIERAEFDVFSSVIRVPRPAQARLAVRTWWRLSRSSR